MASGEATSTLPLRWTERLYQRLPVAPAWIGLAIALGLLVLFGLASLLFGRFDTVQASGYGLWDYREFRLGLVVAALAGALPTARRYLALAAHRNLEDLLPGVDPGRRAAARDRLRLDPGRARLAACLGLVIAPLTGLIVDRDPGLYLLREYWSPETGFSWVVGLFACWMAGLFVYDTVAYGRRFSDLADELVRIDLLDPGALAPFARQGLHTMLLWLVLFSLFAINAIDFVWFVAVGTLPVTLGIAALVLPMRGVHRRLREAKRTELDAVRAAIGGDEAALAGSALARRAGSLGLADLLAWRAYVESVRDWPLDTPQLLRFALYLGIPLGSWLGGALVERLLGLALD